MAFPAGQRPDRVSVQVRTEASDGHDGLVETWTTRYPRWSARVRELSGRDLERARQVDPRTAIEVDFAWWRGFREDLEGGRTRLLVHDTAWSADDRTLEIVGPPVETERRVRVTVPCREAA